NKAVSAAVANVTVPSVTEDLEITVSIHDAGASDFVVVNVQEGELAAKIAECPDRLKVMGTILVEEFSAFAAHANRILDLDLADMTVKGAAMTGNSVPTNAFAPAQAGGTSVLRSIILPKNLERISDNAFARCGALKEVVVPASVNYVGSGAFAACNQLSQITMEGTVPPATGSMSPFPSATSGIALVVPRGYEGAYSTGFWGLIAPKEQKYSYWVKFDPTRAFIFNSSAISNPNNIEVGSSKVDVTVGLPNCPTLSKSGAVYRKGVVFKVYDNGRETTKDYSVSGMNIGGEVYLTGGQYYFQMDPNINPVYNDYPKNHTVDVVFFYPIDVELLDGASGVTSEVIASAEEDKFNATLSKYEYGVPGTRLVYREGKDYKVRLSAPVDNMTLSVEIENRIMTKPGESPEYETVTFEAYPDEEGLYVIPSLPGDTKVKVTGSIKVVEGEPLDAELIANVSKADVADFTELIVEGSMEEEDFRNIRDKFESVETVDLTSMESTVIPAGAFEGMDQLIDVIVSDNVTEIGAGAFKDCGNIESLTLPGVTSIGEGAFDGCESLTSILLPALDDSHAAGKPGMRRAGAADGVSAESFKGLNPNCLIYVGSVDILDSESLNIILNKDGSRVAASDIMLDGNHPFNAPASFLLGDHKISFAAEITASDSCDVDGGWKTIMLPFRPTEMEIGCEFSKREGSGLHILSFDGADSEVMTAQSEILPNRPYLANVCAPFASVPVTFSASARKQVEGEDIVYDVPFTPVPEELVAAGKSFSLFGSYDGESRNVECMMLNESASAFVSGGDTDCKVTPFSAYLCANEGVAETGMKVGEHPLWIREPQVAGESGNRLYRSGKIEMSAPNANASIYYTVDGSDPKAAEGTRRLYSAPFSMEGESMSVKAVAEYKGNLSDIVTFDYELRKAGVDFNLVENWNWISHHTESPVAIADFATAGIDSIVSQTGNAVVDPVKGVTGTLTHLLPVQGYKVRVSGSSWTGSLSGVAYDPAAVVKLASGWNWIGTPADGCSFRIKDLLSGLEVEEGDMIVGLDGFSQVDAEGEWKGTLHEMLPGVGYMFYSNSDKEFVYNIVESCDDEAPAKAPEDTDWTVDIHKYASVMPVVASVEAAAGINADDCRVAAFCGDECRGTGVDVDGSVLINVHGNPGDMINFYVINGEGQELVSTSKLVFEEKPEGTFAQPFAVKVGDTSGIETVTVGSVGISYAGGALTMSGDLSNVEAVEVYDMTGKMIARSAGAGALPIGSVDGSVVTVVIRKADATLSAKLIIR
ncbi:MAG: leucine-rich repeat protein, partial [Muribaculaceae bacterium]|nr:leucine-rich repeat protein [Muribaculaceae bacterium]